MGIPPLATLSTNKLQSVFGTFTASLYFIRKKLVDIKEIKLMIFIAFFGSILGGLVLTQIDSSILSKIIPILLIFMGMGQVIGSLIGAKLVVTKGQKLIRPLIVFISFSMSIKLLFFKI